MVTVHQAALALLILQIYVSAAPSDVPHKSEEELEIDNEEPKLNTPPLHVDIKDTSNLTENQRKKRFYNPFGFEFPPLNPFPTYSKRDQASDLGVYGIDDPLSQIHRRLQEIASVVREPPPTPPPVHFPLYLPVVFVPHFGCDCSSNNDNSPQSTAKPNTKPTTIKPPVDGGTGEVPDIINRTPEMEDERQNWGLVINKTEADYDEEDFSRPISFDPIEPNTILSRPVPPVEHGSSQAGSGNGGQSTTTVRPRPPNNQPRPPGNSPSPPVAIGAPSQGAGSGYPQSSGETPLEAPTTCDGAVLSCCHQPHVTYDCFAIRGCRDTTSYGNPCDPIVILKVIRKYQKFYGVRNEINI